MIDYFVKQTQASTLCKTVKLAAQVLLLLLLLLLLLAWIQKKQKQTI